jgi:AcrR family transcriptional regulator
MPRIAVSPNQRQQTRNKIRDAASKLISTQAGRLDKISARAIASEAGVSVGTIYSYYENLSELCRSICHEPVDDLRREFRADADKVDDPVDRIRLLLEHYARFSTEKHAVFKSVFLFVRPESMKKPNKIELNDEVFYCYLRDAIIEGQNCGQIRDDDPNVLAQTLWAGVHGALALPITLDRFAFDSPRKMANHMINSLLGLITRYN